MARTVIDAIDQASGVNAGLLSVNNDLLRTNNDLLRLVYSILGGAPMTPAQLKARVNKPVTGGKHPGGKQPVRIPGSDVSVTFSWNPPTDAGLTTGYILTIFNPDGSVFDTLTLGLGTSFVESMPDDNQTYTATLVATGDPLTTTPSDPATTSFIPHTEAPPSQLETPTGFTATVS